VQFGVGAKARFDSVQHPCRKDLEPKPQEPKRKSEIGKTSSIPADDERQEDRVQGVQEGVVDRNQIEVLSGATTCDEVTVGQMPIHQMFCSREHKLVSLIMSGFHLVVQLNSI
jgi:hypothetical protein